ncbi:MAG TPA: hypothetical protein VEP68_11965 [Anaeromyxobacteraceae bacterium]|nr:hypothetical protein [Anaeromyxobacteraceae bacterium]
MILARIRLRRQPDLPGLADAGRPLRDLERLVDEDFLRELQPALEEARRARASETSGAA